MNNAQRWMLSLLLGAFGGALTCATESQPMHEQDYIRHALIGMAPTVAALKMTLDKAA